MQFTSVQFTAMQRREHHHPHPHADGGRKRALAVKSPRDRRRRHQADRQLHYGAPPGPCLRKAACVPLDAVAAGVIAAGRGARAVAVSQIVTVVVRGAALAANDVGERVHESSCRDACRAGPVCDAPSPVR
ncbi:hypothetical protein [Streptomyces sp. NPDC001508]|uniref:hypothetical protein n=1 Tax=Streptomyces sp. NPDC001508 TaxID=3154656 RepID=UPI003327CA31